MIKRLRLHLNSLPAQLVLSFMILVLLTAVAAGLPAIWFMRDQLDQQAWAQVEQGSRAAQALYAAQQNEMITLATLTAQRPTLHELLRQKQETTLLTYLRTLQIGAELDLVIVCDPSRQLIAQVGQSFPPNMCRVGDPTGFYVVPEEPAPRVWLLATQAIMAERVELGRVIVGITLTDEFTARIKAQTGLEHTLLALDRPVATSFAGETRQWATVTYQPVQPSPGAAKQNIFYLNGQPYYAARFVIGDLLPLRGPLTLGEPGLEAEVALPVTNIVATRQSLVRTLFASILIVATLGSILGVLLARKISRPLARLTEAATTLSRGDLTSPVVVDTQLREVALVAWALEGARIDLQLTLNDLRREKAWSSHLLESIVEGIMTLDHQGRITFFSQGAERITGWSRDQVIDHNCDQVFRPVDTDEPFSQLIPLPGRRHKIAVMLPDGRQATLAVTGARLLPEGYSARVALVFRDVSDEEAVHRLLGHFLANIAHEFKTPLSALAASVELLLDQTPDLSPAELQELLTSLYLGVLGLQTLVDNLLESASIQAGRFRVSPRPSHLDEIIDGVSHMLHPLLAKRSQSLRVNLPVGLPKVYVDPRRTAQVLVNLLSNASKYGPDGMEITIEAARQANEVYLSVADRGPGIPPEYRKDLFRRFGRERGDNDQAQYGVGLGLSVVKAVVEAQGGQVGVEDRPGGGALFWFTMPVVEEL